MAGACRRSRDGLGLKVPSSTASLEGAASRGQPALDNYQSTLYYVLAPANPEASFTQALL
eukprot:6487109-Prorocentrum_lima.AAC.1